MEIYHTRRNTAIQERAMRYPRFYGWRATFEFFLNYKVGISANYIFPFITIVKFITFTH